MADGEPLFTAELPDVRQGAGGTETGSDGARLPGGPVGGAQGTGSRDINRSCRKMPLSRRSINKWRFLAGSGAAQGGRRRRAGERWLMVPLDQCESAQIRPSATSRGDFAACAWMGRRQPLTSQLERTGHQSWARRRLGDLPHVVRGDGRPRVGEGAGPWAVSILVVRGRRGTRIPRLHSVGTR